ncbi:MAG TPA: hypothetical protein VEK57_04125 [Thermoanaerobaculia bacterium]|nr:hypothetical protein [Thermoanaerobaculia bacterium]
MKTGYRRVSVAALTLVVCLSLAPVATAAVSRDHDDDLRAKIVRMLKKAQKFFGSITSLEDNITPPRP